MKENRIIHHGWLCKEVRLAHEVNVGVETVRGFYRWHLYYLLFLPRTISSFIGSQVLQARAGVIMHTRAAAAKYLRMPRRDDIGRLCSHSGAEHFVVSRPALLETLSSLAYCQAMGWRPVALLRVTPHRCQG